MIKTINVSFTDGIPDNTFLGTINRNDNSTYILVVTSNKAGTMSATYELPDGERPINPIPFTASLDINDVMTSVLGNLKICIHITSGEQVLICQPVIIRVK